MKSFPRELFSGHYGNCHCQGIAVDTAKGYVYYSFTTLLVKTDLSGNLIGTVDGLTGHLGCIDFCDADGRVYGSLEYKNDAIGKGIRSALGVAGNTEAAFYCAIFDVDRITRVGMSAEQDGIMRAVYLREVVEDFCATVTVEGTEHLHRYGCSGIDGTAFGPLCGKKSDREYLHIAYGIYSDIGRADNDYQVILAYDAADWWDVYAKPLNQDNFHMSGPVCCENKFFLYTGNTCYGIQNLEYDPYTGNYLAAVYEGEKPEFPNLPMYVIDGSVPPKESVHRATGEPITELALLKKGVEKAGVYGNRFPLGSTGIYAFGNGYYYFSQSGADGNGQYTHLHLYRLTDHEILPFEPVP